MRVSSRIFSPLHGSLPRVLSCLYREGRDGYSSGPCLHVTVFVAGREDRATLESNPSAQSATDEVSACLSALGDRPFNFLLRYLGGA